jgi:parallel beta-helix repeat protein
MMEMLRARYILITLGLIGLVLLSLLLIAFETGSFSNRQTSSSPFFVGVEIGWRASVTEAEALIDHVKNYTNLLVIGASTITSNEVWLDQTCDYAYNASMYIIVYWDSSDNSPGAVTNTAEHPYHPYEWVTKTKEKYGIQFLGAYYCDEPGGKKLDSGDQEAPTSYSDIANSFVECSQAKDFAPINHQLGNLIFTSDYGLYWFDYEAGYDVVLAQLGWNNSRPLQIALTRGAATAQNKDWGVIITWTYNQPPYLESGAQLYDDMVLAYDSGAKYAVIYDASQAWSNTTLTEEHFEAMKNFWAYMQQNPQKQGSLKADTALVLPQDYGFGFRSPDDSIWGLKQADTWSQKMYNDVNNLLSEYGSRLDIVYNDPEFNNATKNSHSNVLYWTAGTAGSGYPVVDLNSTMGYATIQDAISAYATCPGNTLYVKSGTYLENVVVNKAIALIGEDKATTIIDGSDNGTALYIASDNVTVTGFTLQNGGNLTSETDGGLVLDNADNCNITGNIITASNNGIYFHDSANSILRNNSLSGNRFNFGVNGSTPQDYVNDVDSSNTINGKPIYYWINKHDQTVPSDAGYVALINCTNIDTQNLHISNNYNGLILAYTQNSTISNNTFTANYEGIIIDTASGNVLRNNTMTGNAYNFGVSNGLANDIDTSNTVDGKSVIYWVNQHDKTIPANAGYVALINCSGITVQSLDLSNNGQGILLYNTTNSTITQNIIKNEGTGIELNTSTNNTITQNSLKTNANNGITAMSSNGNTFLKNTLTGNGGSGLYIYASSNNRINLNNITANGCGISFQNSPYANSTFNIVTENWITNNNLFIDMKYGGALNNTLYHNNFINNANQLFDNGTNPPMRGFLSFDNVPKNFWDNGKEGNYWSDYNGTDSNHDGIGDIACYIRNIDQDNYPLMQPFPTDNLL